MDFNFKWVEENPNYECDGQMDFEECLAALLTYKNQRKQEEKRNGL